MHRRTTRLNHVLLVVVGIVLLAAGTFLLARHFGWISQLPKSDRLYSRPQRRWVHDHTWAFAVVGGAAALVGLVALRWLFVQPRIDRLRRLPIDPDTGQHGRTVLAATALTDQVEEDLESHPGVARARVLVTGRADTPTLVLRVAAHAAGDIDAVREFLVEDALPAARTALEAEGVPMQLHLLVAGKTEQRVVV
ncbi:hypothetical protein [Jatrophihabitans fulvus]